MSMVEFLLHEHQKTWFLVTPGSHIEANEEPPNMLFSERFLKKLD